MGALDRHLRSPALWLAVVFCLVSLVLAVPWGTAVSAGSASDAWHRTHISWGIGVVVPNGAGLSGGKALSWSSVANLTAVVSLPNITRPDAITYVVLSAMGSDKTVFQVAAGAWPNSTDWTVYSWHVTGIGAPSAHYQWAANATGAGFIPGDLLSISLLRSPSAWDFAVIDHSSGESQEGSFPASSGVTFGVGDQEVIAFESYSRSPSTFREMGNLTLEPIIVDGSRVTGGWYYYSGWDPEHNPLFSVGNSQAPLFVSVTTDALGGTVWGYSTEWAGVNANLSLQPLAASYIAAGLALGGVAFAWHRRLRRASA